MCIGLVSNTYVIQLIEFVVFFLFSFLFDYLNFSCSDKTIGAIGISSRIQERKKFQRIFFINSSSRWPTIDQQVERKWNLVNTRNAISWEFQQVSLQQSHFRCTLATFTWLENLPFLIKGSIRQLIRIILCSFTTPHEIQLRFFSLAALRQC